MASERKFVSENIRRVLLKEYLMKEVSRAGFGGLQVQRRPNGTHIELITERPGLVIGPRGQTIKMLTLAIKNDFNFENPQIEVVEVDNANLNAQIMAEKLAFSLERGWHFRRAGHSTVRRIMESGARGCHIILAGKLTGQRHRTEKFKEGHIKFCGEPSELYITHGYAVAKLKMGVIGVTVEIMDRNSVLPTDISVVNKTKAFELFPDIFVESAEEPAFLEAIEEPVEVVEEPAPAKKAEKPVTAEKVEKPAPVKKAKAPAPAKKAEKPVTTEKVEKPAPVEKAKAPAPAKKAEKPVTTEKVEKPVPVEKAEKPVAEKVEEPATTEEVKEPVPAKEEVQ
jgi:small subunit ribosomal protein S3